MRADLTKEEFCYALELLDENSKMLAQMTIMLGTSPDWVGVEFVNSMYEVIITLIKPTEIELDMIQWFCWDIGFGTDYMDGDLVVDGQEFPIHNCEDLWNYFNREDKVIQ